MGLNLERIQNATASDIIENGHYYGMPDATNPAEVKAFMDRMRPREDDKFAMVEGGPTIARDGLKRILNVFITPEGRRIDCGTSAAMVIRVASDYGYGIGDIEPKMHLVPDLAHKWDSVAEWHPKSSLILPR